MKLYQKEVVASHVLLYMKRYGSTDGSDLRMRIKGEENVAIVGVCVVGSIRMVEGRNNVRAMGR